jgi:hypothetical protein
MSETASQSVSRNNQSLYLQSCSMLHVHFTFSGPRIVILLSKLHVQHVDLYPVKRKEQPTSSRKSAVFEAVTDQLL